MRRRLAVACPVVLAVAAMLLQGCALTTHFAYTNTTLARTENKAPQASFEIKRRTKQYGDVLVLLALSGGGSRAAYYAASFDAGTPGIPPGRRKWDERTVTDLMSRNYIARWIGNWFWPLNIAKFWLTAFDRTDIMAQTFADNFFDSTRTGVDLRIRDLNLARPNLVLNATIGSRSYREDDPARTKLFGTVFTFTHEDFAAKLNSDVADYELARAVMASATFPAAFNYMTLRDFHEPPDCPDHGGVCYVHVFDGGNSDNLGLISIKRVLLSDRARATS